MADVKTEEKDYIVLSMKPEEVRELCRMAAKEGAKAALDRFNQEKEKANNKVIDKRFHNTKLLLRNYHMLKLNMDHSIYGRSQMDESAADILSSMMNLYDDEVIVDAIKRSTTRTAIMVSHIEGMINLYRVYCQQSRNELDQRRYEVLYDRYMADEVLSVREIAKKQHMTTDNVYRDLGNAVEKVSALIFGIEGLKNA